MSLVLRYRWAWALLALIPVSSHACQICVPMPERTLADRLLAYDAKGARWSALGITNPEYEHVVRQILAHAGRWRPRETGNAARLDWFVGLLGHPDTRLHELAYLEIGRAPYAEIRRRARDLPPNTLSAMLDDPRYLEWRSLAILILGESGRAGDQARVRDTLSRKATLGSSRNLAAWATALVAVDGLGGVRRLESLYLSGAPRRREELEAVAQALSVHAAAEPTLREPAAALYRRMLEAHPSLAPKLVHDLIAWQRWDFVEPVRRARADLAGDPLAAYALGLYLRMAGGGSGHVGGLPNAGGSSASKVLDRSSQEAAR